MAFQQPQQRPQAPRQVSVSGPANEAQVQASPARKRTLEESQEWVLFSPAQNADTASRTSQTPRTATHLSDFGSLETHVRSQPLGSNSIDEGEATCLGTEVEDDGAELDSLDDGLRAFQHDPFDSAPYQLDQSGGTLLPTHDGLGTFTSSAGLQEQLWQFERYNPHRRRHIRRKSSLQRRIEEAEEERELSADEERIARIEKWRLEQSKAVLDEIEKEAKRRQRRMSKMSAVSGTMDIGLERVVSTAPLREDSVILEEPEVSKNEEPEASESWWQRITRRVIQDLIGLDESTLSVIFGEELPDNASPTPTQSSPLAAAASAESRVTFKDQERTWETKLMERVAKELGVLVNQLTEHEGAFSTYQRTLSELENQKAAASTKYTQPESRLPDTRFQRRTSTATKPSSEPLFSPTLPQTPASPSTEQPDTSLWGIEEEPNEQTTAQSVAYWQQDLDLKTIFSALRARFAAPPAPNPPTPEPTFGPLPSSWATSATSRAEHIRQNHPLVSRAAAAQSRRRESLLRRHAAQTLLQRGGGSSCASHSTKRSRRSRSGESSRRYWEFGSGGSGFSGGPLGGWGEV